MTLGAAVSCLDQASKLRQRALLLENKAKLNAVIGVLKTNPGVIDNVLSHLKSLGLDTTAPTVARNCQMRSQGDEVATGLDNVVDDDDDKEKLPRCDTQLCDLKAATLARLLGGCEPVACSTASLKALLQHGKRVHTKPPLLELLEIMSGLPPTFSWGQMARSSTTRMCSASSST
jgi:hypothetical protein